MGVRPMPKETSSTHRQTGWKVRIVNHWRDISAEVENKQGKDLLIAMCAFIAREFSSIVEREDIVDTGFYRDSVYINGQGITSYEYTRKSGTYYGYNHTQTYWDRERAPRVTPSNRKRGMVVGVAAAYAYWLELSRGQSLTEALYAAKQKYGGTLRLTIDKKDLNL